MAWGEKAETEDRAASSRQRKKKTGSISPGFPGKPANLIGTLPELWGTVQPTTERCHNFRQASVNCRNLDKFQGVPPTNYRTLPQFPASIRQL